MTDKNLFIGLTGGIGSGKSEVSRRFANWGITIVDADEVARNVVQPGSFALAKISAHFGNNILTQAGELNRAELREIIFANGEAKAWLEQLLHPIINNEIRRLLAESTSIYTLLVSPLLLETEQHQLVARILVVDTSEQLQIERAMQRDKNSTQQIVAIMQTQLSRQERCNRANDIIQNHGDMTELDVQVAKLHQLYCELANIKTKNLE